MHQNLSASIDCIEYSSGVGRGLGIEVGAWLRKDDRLWSAAVTQPVTTGYG